MNPRHVSLALAAVCLGLATPAVAASTLTPPAPVGDHLYAVTNTAHTAFDRDIDGLRAGALAAAKKFCADRGEEIRIISVVADKPHFSLGYCSVKVIFQPLKPGDPEPAATADTPAPPAPAGIVPAPGIPVANSLTGTGDYYTDLLKLDDLHKRGIITDEEFEKQKKKILKDWK
ncbi:MAG TPA: SHOCT domain-containing protein [Opitutus sp.]|nr:SHOCT domain-containing protein [Opitutus sp.]